MPNAYSVSIKLGSESRLAFRGLKKRSMAYQVTMRPPVGSSFSDSAEAKRWAAPRFGRSESPCRRAGIA